ncbi:MAG: response regulator [Chitinophagaceae bacterium]|nr:response regulator [Chitinophagaceae bacterium]
MKVMIVEDEMLVLKTMEFKMKRQGFDVICCKNGKEAIDKMKIEKPDVVVTNMMLPGRTGLDVIGSAKKLIRDVSVIVVSALKQENALKEAFDLGADDFISKPFNLNELVIRIKHLTGSNEKVELALSK